MHSATARISVGVAGAYKGMKNKIQEEGEKAEVAVNRIGVPTEDIRALVPHFEATIFRLGRLSARLIISRQGAALAEKVQAAAEQTCSEAPDMKLESVEMHSKP